MCVALGPDIAVISFISCIAENLKDAERQPNEIFKIRFRPETIVKYARVLKQYDDVTRCYTLNSLNESFKHEWKDIFVEVEDGDEKYVRLSEKGYNNYKAGKDDKLDFTLNCDDCVRPIVLYLLSAMRPRLIDYPLRFLKNIGIYRQSLPLG